MFLCPCFYAGEIRLEWWGHLWGTFGWEKARGPGAPSHILLQGKVICPLYLAEQARACAVSAPAVFLAGSVPTLLRVVSLCSSPLLWGSCRGGTRLSENPLESLGKLDDPKSSLRICPRSFSSAQSEKLGRSQQCFGGWNKTSVCLQAMLAIYRVYKTRAVVLFCTSSLIPLLITIWSSYLSQWHTVLFKYSLPLQKNFK